MRNLASIQKIGDLQSIPNADTIEVASVLGWKVVVKKGEFKINDLCVYCEIDSVLPPKPEFEFLASKKYRVRTIKLRGQISQGIAFPLHFLQTPTRANELGSVVEGQDVTEYFGVVKYEIPEVQIPGPGSKGPSRKVGKSFPAYVIKTDETRIQSIPHILEEIKGVPLYISMKIDGTSGTFAYKDGKIDVCSRTVSRPDPQYQSLWMKLKRWYEIKILNRKYTIPEDCVYWNAARKYSIIEILKQQGRMGRNLAIQGEIAGPNIQGNKLKLQDQQLFVFNVFDIDKQEYFSVADFFDFCKQYGLQTVPVLHTNWFAEKKVVTGNQADGMTFSYEPYTIEDFLELAKGLYPSGYPREGIVIRPMVEQYSQALRGRMSFKAINNEFLLLKEN